MNVHIFSDIHVELKHVMYGKASSVQSVYTFEAVAEWIDDFIQIPDMLNDTVDTTLIGPDLFLSYTETYSDGTLFSTRNCEKIKSK